ncbi:Hypothetical protein NTJ_01803 [Nesidiocoris tenuis]|uniref:Uncharacterized protein n=1 Tax=Nesidiocoris tenuis TaxID=355587 RepID=A0ABN7ADQ4_9HEMI|nr:Hypothetical protein NTJ_01803 [Nesidiocoris tenuis]
MPVSPNSKLPSQTYQQLLHGHHQLAWRTSPPHQQIYLLSSARGWDLFSSNPSQPMRSEPIYRDDSNSSIYTSPVGRGTMAG